MALVRYHWDLARYVHKGKEEFYLDPSQLFTLIQPKLDVNIINEYDSSSAQPQDFLECRKKMKMFPKIIALNRNLQNKVDQKILNN